MFRLVLTSSNIFDTGKQFVKGMLKCIFFHPLLNFQLKSIWTIGKERGEEERVIIPLVFVFKTTLSSFFM